LDVFKPTTAFIGTMYVGTEKLGRPLTDAEKKDLASLFRRHDFVGASMIALRFAFRLRSNKAAARDLQGRANLRLVVHGWDPREVTLPKRLCRLVWSEHTNELRENANRRKAEEGFLREQGLQHSPSPEDLATRLATEQEEEERAARRFDALRAAFVEADDHVNVRWLDFTLEGIREPAEMARKSGLDVRDFYRATDRRNRHIARLAAADSGGNTKKEDR
jgi:hypothetical protein